MQRLTVRDAARLMNVSERAVYMVGELQRAGRDDLIREVEAGRMSILGALKIAKPERYGPKQDANPSALRRAWQSSSESDRIAFLNWVAANG